MLSRPMNKARVASALGLKCNGKRSTYDILYKNICAMPNPDYVQNNTLNFSIGVSEDYQALSLSVGFDTACATFAASYKIMRSRFLNRMLTIINGCDVP